MNKAFIDVSLPLIQAAVFKNTVTVESAEVLENGNIRFTVSGNELPPKEKDRPPPLVNMYCQPLIVEDYIVEGFSVV